MDNNIDAVDNELQEIAANDELIWNEFIQNMEAVDAALENFYGLLREIDHLIPGRHIIIGNTNHERNVIEAEPKINDKLKMKRKKLNNIKKKNKRLKKNASEK